MKEKFDPKNKETPRDKLIKARASLDAYEYISLKRKAKKENELKLEPDGTLVINNDLMLSDVKAKLNLTQEEMIKYMFDLSDAIKSILYK